MNEIPSNNIPDETEPKMKYFMPASDDLLESRLMQANIYKDRLCNSKDK